MLLQILLKQQVFLDSSDVTKGDRIMKYFMIIVAALVLTACGNEEAEKTESNTQTESDVTIMFQNMDLKSQDNTFTLTGEAAATDGELFYVIDQGKERLIEEKRVTLEKAGEWTSFEIKETLPESSMEGQDPPIITLYGKDATNKMVNPNYIPVDFAMES